MSSQGHLGAMEESGAGKQRDQICFRRIPLALLLEGELKGWRGQEPREGTAQAGEKGPTPGGGLHKAGNCLMRGRGRRQSRSLPGLLAPSLSVLVSARAAGSAQTGPVHHVLPAHHW